eukprot:g731.t1
MQKATDEQGRLRSGTESSAQTVSTNGSFRETAAGGTATKEIENGEALLSPTSSSSSSGIRKKASFRNLFKKSPSVDEDRKRSVESVESNYGNSREAKALSMLLKDGVTNVAIVAKLLRSLSRSASTVRRNSLSKNEYFEDHGKGPCDFDQKAIVTLIDKLRDMKVEPEVWRKPELLAVVPYRGDVNLIPPMMTRMIKTGHALDGDGYFPELDAILSRRYCLVLKLDKNYKTDFYAITEAEMRELYGEIPCGLSFEDVCKDKGDIYAERIRLIPGITFLEEEGMIFGARRKGKMETYRTSQLGIPINERIVCESHWRGHQVKEKNDDAYVVINKTAGAYLVSADGDRPFGYRKFYDCTQDHLRNLVDTARNDVTIKSQKWRKPGITCLFFYNRQTSLIPSSVIEAMGSLSKAVSSPSSRTSRASGVAMSYLDSFGFDENDVVVMQFAKDGSPNFYPITSANCRKLYTGFRNDLTFADVVEVNGKGFCKRLFEMQGVEELVRRGFILGGKRRGFVETVKASELGLPVDDYVCVEANWHGSQEIKRGEDAFVVINNYRGPYLLFVDDDGAKHGSDMRPLAYELFSRSRAKKDAEAMRKNSVTTRMPDNVLDILIERTNIFGHFTIPDSTYTFSFCISLALTVFGLFSNVFLQIVSVIVYATNDGEDASPSPFVRAALAGAFVALPFIVKPFFVPSFGETTARKCALALPLFDTIVDASVLSKKALRSNRDVIEKDSQELLRLNVTRLLVVALQCIPLALCHTFFALSLAEDSSGTLKVVSIISAAWSCVVAGILSAGLCFDVDTDPRKRGEDDTVFGYYCDEAGSQVFMFALESVESATYMATRCIALGMAFVLLSPYVVLAIFVVHIALLLLLRVLVGNLWYYHRNTKYRGTLTSFIVSIISVEMTPMAFVRTPYVLGGFFALAAYAYVIAENFVLVILAFGNRDETDDEPLLAKSSVLLMLGLMTFVLALVNAIIPLVMADTYDIRNWLYHHTPRSHFRDVIWHNFQKNPYGPTIDDHRGRLLEIWAPIYWSSEQVRPWLCEVFREWSTITDIKPNWCTARWESFIPRGYLSSRGRSNGAVAVFGVNSARVSPAHCGPSSPNSTSFMSPSGVLRSRKTPNTSGAEGYDDPSNIRTFSADSVSSQESTATPGTTSKRNSWVQPMGLINGNESDGWNPLAALEMKIIHPVDEKVDDDNTETALETTASDFA